MPLFEEALGAAWTEGMLLNGSAAWHNLNAVIARLTSTGAVDLSSYGLWTVPDALERE